MMQGWRTALIAAINLKGYNIRDGEYSIDCQLHFFKIMQECLFFSSLQDIAGIKAHLEKLNSQLQIEINDVRIVGIWGISGDGKTTIAKDIFDTLCYQFEASCFLTDVKEKKDDYVKNKYDGQCMIQSRLCSKKVLIVLDGIDHSHHLEYLAGDLGWFGDGIRVILTTRNRHLIEKDEAIYERFNKFSLELVNHAKGHPLALKWRSTLHRIKKNSTSKIVDKLKISYDGLEPEEQKIFLDMACFF
ncbi:hypothetical protein H5410_028310 [Solanum commersonii]|uniref:NB-ARC domain-containing protein n=1 Tax=Solanum commersonii TaxID=4109 RepID=A0A9J5Z2B5_SOLCO|nr:hypothetical protein H5410_028310 [Solanum commersonii]